MQIVGAKENRNYFSLPFLFFFFFSCFVLLLFQKQSLVSDADSRSEKNRNCSSFPFPLLFFSNVLFCPERHPWTQTQGEIGDRQAREAKANRKQIDNRE